MDGMDLRSRQVRFDPSAASIAWIARAARLPAPMASITVAAPVTMSPPAKTRALEVRPV
jgi:hypothetical protein